MIQFRVSSAQQEWVAVVDHTLELRYGWGRGRCFEKDAQGTCITKLIVEHDIGKYTQKLACSAVLIWENIGTRENSILPVETYGHVDVFSPIPITEPKFLSEISIAVLV